MFEQALARPMKLLRDLAAEAAEFAETRVALLHIEWQGEKSRLEMLAILVLAAMALVALSFMFVGLAVIVWFWDTPQRALVAGLVALAMIVMCAVTIAALLKTASRGKAAFSRSRAELAHDWRLVKERL